MNKVPITRNGFRLLMKELAHLRRSVRPQVLEELFEARSFGIKLDNQQYLLARERLMVLQRKIRELEEKLAACEVVVGRKYYLKRVGFGTCALIQNIESGESLQYQLVGPFESDIRNGKLSINSPVGKNLLGRAEGEEVTIYTPAGERTYRILSIQI
jgi:transcription elongation factor GreA